MLTESTNYRIPFEMLIPYPKGLLKACEESWLEGALGKRKSARLAVVASLLSPRATIGDVDELARVEAELDPLIVSTSGDVWESRLVTIRLSIGPEEYDGFLLRYSNDESGGWSGEYYVWNGFVRVSVILDAVDVERLVDYYVAVLDAERTDDFHHDQGPLPGHVCFPRRLSHRTPKGATR